VFASKETANNTSLQKLIVAKGRADICQQCCGSGYGIRCFFYAWIRDPRCVKKSGIRIRDKQPGSYFRELRNNFWVKILKFFDADPGSGMEKILIREEHSGSAKLSASQIP
jgi:hypothetical protein